MSFRTIFYIIFFHISPSAVDFVVENSVVEFFPNASPTKSGADLETTKIWGGGTRKLGYKIQYFGAQKATEKFIFKFDQFSKRIYVDESDESRYVNESGDAGHSNELDNEGNSDESSEADIELADIV